MLTYQQFVEAAERQNDHYAAGSFPAEEVIQKLLTLPVVPNFTHLPRPKFLLPDGTLVASRGGTHSFAAALLGLSLGDVVHAGACRIIVEQGALWGVLTGTPLTNIQAKLLASAPANRFDSLDIDVVDKQGNISSVIKDHSRMTASALQQIVSARLPHTSHIDEDMDILTALGKQHDDMLWSHDTFWEALATQLADEYKYTFTRGVKGAAYVEMPKFPGQSPTNDPTGLMIQGSKFDNAWVITPINLRNKKEWQSYSYLGSGFITTADHAKMVASRVNDLLVKVWRKM